MVPVVTLMALSIGISGYYIQNERILREQEQAETSSQESEFNSDGLMTPEEIKQKETIVNKDTSSDSDKDKKDLESSSVEYVVNVEATVKNKKVSIKGEIETTDPGTCVMSIKKGSFGPESQVETTGGSCEIEFDNPGSGEWVVTVVYTSSDGKSIGSATSPLSL